MSKARTCPTCGVRKAQREFKIPRELTNAETKSCAKGHSCAECQLQRAAIRRLDPQQDRRHAMIPYALRDATLRSMGFPTYAAYLQSVTWSRIRARVLKLRSYRCEKCGGRATQVHHNVYGRAELCGKSLKGMKALCGDCHKGIEFDGARKVGANESSHRFYA